jgi:outer membrane protein OmpA-like peptidoglycan-associated protein
MNILNEFIEFLDENPKVKIAIHGHTDNVGDQASNLELSTNRAKAVMNYLILEGISSARLEFKGFGESKPIASNQTEEGRAKNRRTEFVILSK